MAEQSAKSQHRLEKLYSIDVWGSQDSLTAQESQ